MEDRPYRNRLSRKNLTYRGVPSNFHKASIDQYDDPDYREFFRKYMNNLDLMIEDNMNIVLYGKNGAGKSFLTSLVVKEAYRKRLSSFRVTLQEYINLQFRKKEYGVARKIQEILHCELLVIDEVGKETFGEKQFNIITLEEVLRHRDMLGKPTFLCMNLPLEGKGGLYAQYGQSIESLVNGQFIKLEFEGEDYRPKTYENKSAMKVLLDDDLDFEGDGY